MTMTRRQRRRVTLAAQYAIFVLVVGFVAFSADWAALKQNFAREDVASGLFPAIIEIALKNTIIYTLTGFSFGAALGLLLALMRLSSVGPYRWFAKLYVEIFRGLPALIIFLFIGTGIPLAFPGADFPPGGTTGKVAFALGLVAAAYMAETFRAGIQAVPKGQMEAARSLGMSSGRAMRSIVIPQAFRIIVPPLTNELVLLFKDSSLVFLLGVQLNEKELSKFGRDAAGARANATPLLIAALCYLLITIPLGFLVRRLEARNAKSR